MHLSSRTGRGWWVWVALASFCFAQLAVAAYVCPNPGETARFEAMATGEGDCHRSNGDRHDEDNAQLCKAYCERDAQAKPSTGTDQADLAHAAQPVLHLRAPAAVAHEHPTFRRVPHGGPPLYLRHCVLRN